MKLNFHFEFFIIIKLTFILYVYSLFILDLLCIIFQIQRLIRISSILLAFQIWRIEQISFLPLLERFESVLSIKDMILIYWSCNIYILSYRFCLAFNMCMLTLNYSSYNGCLQSIHQSAARARAAW